MTMIPFHVTLKHKDTGEELKFDIKANNGSDCIGRIIEGKAKFPQPKAEDPTKMKIQKFLPEGNWIIENIDCGKYDYPEIVGKII